MAGPDPWECRWEGCSGSCSVLWSHTWGGESSSVSGRQGSQEAWLLRDPPPRSSPVLPSSRLHLASQPNITAPQASKPLPPSTICLPSGSPPASRAPLFQTGRLSGCTRLSRLSHATHRAGNTFSSPRMHTFFVLFFFLIKFCFNGLSKFRDRFLVMLFPLKNTDFKN